ncbi:hypothetical protein AMTRI_Chr09g13610 [Amborella trichopoda]
MDVRMEMNIHQQNGEQEMNGYHGKRLKGKVAIITGGARGIGAAAARLFALHGAHVTVADILDDEGPALCTEIGARYMHCDVSLESDVAATVRSTVAQHGCLDIMFNNAGIAGQLGSITHLNSKLMQNLLSVNLCGPVYGIKHAAQAMIKGRVQGSIVCTASSAALMGGLGSHAYTMSKEAVVGIVRSAACELGVHGIRVNCVSPHGVASDMLVGAYREILGREDLGAEAVDRVVAESGSLLKGRSATPEDVANAALFLASDESGFVTGHNLVVDGGFTSACNTMSFIYQ